MLTHQVGEQVSNLWTAAPNLAPMSRCLVVQHIAPEKAFAIEEALTAAGVAVETVRVFAGDPVPAEVTGLDGLVVMGGPMSADSDEGFASRQAELALLSAAVAAGIPTLGVCLGAQLLAQAMGGSVRRGEAGPEIGWGVVELTDACSSDALFADVPSDLEVLQWHGDTFSLPDGGVLLASNATYASQAFRIGPLAWGLQFHIEVEADAVAGFLEAFGADTDGVSGGPEQIRAETPAALARLAPFRRMLLGRFAQLVAADISETDLVVSG
jgi:GMP synthase-like glutamine amidotransferase